MEESILNNTLNFDINNISNINNINNDINESWVGSNIKQYFLGTSDLVILLEPLIKALQWSGDYRQLVESLPHSNENLNLTEFLNVMAAINYNSEAVKVRLDKIPKKYLPCLFIPDSGAAMVVLDRNLYACDVVAGETGNVVRIRDSKINGTLYHFSKLPLDEFELSKKKESFKSNLIRFKGLMVQAGVLSFFYNLFMAMVPIYVMMVFDKVISAKSIGMLITFLMGILIILIGGYLLQSSRNKIVAYIGAKIDKNVGESVIHHLLYLSASYTENDTVGSQISRIKDFDSIKDFFTSPVALMISEVPFAIIFFVIMCWIGGWLAIIPVILGLVFLVLYKLTNPISRRLVKTQSVASAKKQSFLLQSFTNIVDIKGTGNTLLWKDKYNHILTDVAGYSFDVIFHSTVLSSISDFLMMLAALLILVIGSSGAMDGDVSLGALIAVMMLTWKILNPLKTFFSSLPTIGKMQASVQQVDRLFAIPIERTPDRVMMPPAHKMLKVEFVRVSYKYKPNAPPSILGISFHVEPGEIVAITGKNSAGKSTLLRLLLGLYAPQAGNINVEDMNISQFDPIEYRHAIAYVAQENKLFFGTIKQNLLFGNLLVNNYDIEIAARMAGVHDDIMELEHGYDTRVGNESGAKFTASFIQKIALARAYLKKARIMLFDEPANSLDEQADHQFMNMLSVFKQKATILMVTHRPSHFKVADKIMCLNEGQIVIYGPSAYVLEKLKINVEPKKVEAVEAVEAKIEPKVEPKSEDKADDKTEDKV